MHALQPCRALSLAVPRPRSPFSSAALQPCRALGLAASQPCWAPQLCRPLGLAVRPAARQLCSPLALQGPQLCVALALMPFSLAGFQPCRPVSLAPPPPPPCIVFSFAGPQPCRALSFAVHQPRSPSALHSGSLAWSSALHGPQPCSPSALQRPSALQGPSLADPQSCICQRCSSSALRGPQPCRALSLACHLALKRPPAWQGLSALQALSFAEPSVLQFLSRVARRLCSFAALRGPQPCTVLRPAVPQPCSAPQPCRPPQPCSPFQSCISPALQFLSLAWASALQTAQPCVPPGVEAPASLAGPSALHQPCVHSAL